MTSDALPFVVYAEEAALIDAHRHYSRDRANERERPRRDDETADREQTQGNKNG